MLKTEKEGEPMTAIEKRQAVVAQYKIILGRNLYSQDAAKRECCFTPYKDGKYYSDCSSSIRLAYKRAGIGLNNIGGNTVGMYQNKNGVIIDCAIKSGVPTDVGMLRVGDILLFAGNDSARAYADYVGHVEMVYAISGTKVTLCGHGSGNPKTHEMTAYCKSRQNTKASTKKGNRGLLKVVRFIPDDEIYPADPMKDPPKQPEHGIKITGSTVNLRTGPGTDYATVATAKAGQVYERIDTDWFPILVDSRVLWVSDKYAKEV